MSLGVFCWYLVVVDTTTHEVYAFQTPLYPVTFLLLHGCTSTVTTVTQGGRTH